MLDADNTTLRSLVPAVRTAGVSGDGAAVLAPGAGSGTVVVAGAVVGGTVTGVDSSNTMVRETPGRSVWGMMVNAPTHIGNTAVPARYYSRYHSRR